MSDYLVLVAGLVTAGVGGELFVRGLVGVARWARIPVGIVGASSSERIRTGIRDVV